MARTSAPKGPSGSRGRWRDRSDAGDELGQHGIACEQPRRSPSGATRGPRLELHGEPRLVEVSGRRASGRLPRVAALVGAVPGESFRRRGRLGARAGRDWSRGHARRSVARARRCRRKCGHSPPGWRGLARSRARPVRPGRQSLGGGYDSLSSFASSSLVTSATWSWKRIGSHPSLDGLACATVLYARTATGPAGSGSPAREKRMRLIQVMCARLPVHRFADG